MTDTEQYWIDQYHDAMAALRKVSAERDALRARIANAPKVKASSINDAGKTWVAINCNFPEYAHLAGKRVALVLLGDDE